MPQGERSGVVYEDRFFDFLMDAVISADLLERLIQRVERERLEELGALPERTRRRRRTLRGRAVLY